MIASAIAAGFAVALATAGDSRIQTELPLRAGARDPSGGGLRIPGGGTNGGRGRDWPAGVQPTDGSTDPHSAGTYVGANGAAVHLNAEDFTMTPAGGWTSPATGGVYPLEWRVEVPKLDLDLNVTTPLQAQEIVPTNGRGPTYWEGAVDVEGGGVRGAGYLEMTGYTEPLRLGIERRAP